MADDDSLAESFWAVARHLRHLTKEFLAPWDVSPSQSRALMVLARSGAMRPGELAGYLRIAPRSATEVVDGLEERGLVARRRDPDDRRATILELTGDGRALMEKLRAARATETDAYFGRLSATDQAHLQRILRKLRED